MPIFLAGHRKSGTSLLHMLFDGHPSLMAYPTDLTVMYAYYPHYTEKLKHDSELRARLNSVLSVSLKGVADARRSDAVLDADAILNEFWSIVQHDRLRDMKHVIESLSKAAGSVLFQGRKEPLKALFKETSIDIYAAELLSWFEGGKIIHLVRDPRDNYAALKAGVEKRYSLMGESELMTLASMVNRARFDMRAGRINERRFKGRYKIVRFEDLVSDVEGVMKNLSTLLDLEFDPILLEPTLLGRPAGGNSYDGEVHNGVSAKNAGRWRERISEEEGCIIEFFLANEMKNLGYPTVFSGAQTLDAAMEFYKWYNYRYFYSDPIAFAEANS